jgi:hypothetical protein
LLNIKEQLGFSKGPITLFKGDTYSHLDWFRNSVAKYKKFCGWYIPSTEQIPNDIPADLETKTLYWEEISSDDNTLLPDHIIKEVIDNLLYDISLSNYVGFVGERIERKLLVTNIKNIDTYYGNTNIYTMEDENKNVFVWITTSANTFLTKNKWYKIIGTIKQYKKYHNVKQNILSRCRIKEE